jgi:shikimate kinase
MVDVDLSITARSGRTVREIWEQGGEQAYRHFESDIVLNAMRQAASTVIAAPGGVVLDPVVRAALVSAFVVWLRTDPVVLAGRVGFGDHRPLLGDDPLGVLSVMDSQRSEQYRSVADMVTDTDALDSDAVTSLIVERVHDPSPGSDIPH